MALEAGFAEADCTPLIGLPLMGHPRDEYAAAGVHDPLHARAMVLANGAGDKLGILSVDVCMFTAELVATIRGKVSRRRGLAGDRLLVAATHTHAGPATCGIYGMPVMDASALEAILDTAADAVVAAVADLKPATLAVGIAREDRLSFNRRLRCRDNSIHMNWEPLDRDFVIEPLGPIDPDVVVVTVRQTEGRSAAVVNFALHPAILDYENQLYSAGWPGYLAEAMNRIAGEPITTLFVNGCCGNINHLDYTDPHAPRRGYAAAQRTGYMLAVAASEASRQARLVVGETLTVSRQFVPLVPQRISEDERAWAESVLAGTGVGVAGHDADGLPAIHRAAAWMDLYSRQDLRYSAEVMVIRVGDLAVVGLPGEAFCELGLEIKHRSPARHTMVIALANDGIGYLPTPEAFDQGGYETTRGATWFDRSAGRDLAASAIQQLNVLFANRDSKDA